MWIQQLTILWDMKLIVLFIYILYPKHPFKCLILWRNQVFFDWINGRRQCWLTEPQTILSLTNFIIIKKKYHEFQSYLWCSLVSHSLYDTIDFLWVSVSSYIKWSWPHCLVDLLLKLHQVMDVNCLLYCLMSNSKLWY